MISILCEMQSCGADIAKLAVMPKSIQDVLNLMLASAKAFENLNIPLITMSMGKLGSFSRVAGLLTGSCATFGSYGQESAPGQFFSCETWKPVFSNAVPCIICSNCASGRVCGQNPFFESVLKFRFPVTKKPG